MARHVYIHQVMKTMQTTMTDGYNPINTAIEQAHATLTAGEFETFLEWVMSPAVKQESRTMAQIEVAAGIYDYVAHVVAWRGAR